MYMYACECNRSSLTLVPILIVFTQYPLLRLLQITHLVSLSDLLLVLYMHILNIYHSIAYYITYNIKTFVIIIYLPLSSSNLAGVIATVAVLLILVTAIAVIIVIVIVCIIKRNRRKGGPEGNGEGDNTEHYYSLATEKAQPPRIQGDNKNDMIVYDQVEGGGLNGTDTYEEPDAGGKVHNKVTNAKTSGNGKQNTNIPGKYSKLQQNVPQEQSKLESTSSEGHYDVADSRPYQDKYDMIGSGMYINSAAAKKESENVPITQPNTKPSKSKHPEDIKDEMPKNGNDPSELYTQPNKMRKHNEELNANHDQVDPEELYTQPDKKKKIKKPPPYASRHKGDDPEALYTAVDKAKK